MECHAILRRVGLRELTNQIEFPESLDVVPLESIEFRGGVIVGMRPLVAGIGQIPLFLDPSNAGNGEVIGAVKGLLGAHHDKCFRDFFHAQNLGPSLIPLALRKVFRRPVFVGMEIPGHELRDGFQMRSAQSRKGKVLAPAHDLGLSHRYAHPFVGKGSVGDGLGRFFV